MLNQNDKGSALDDPERLLLLFARIADEAHIGLAVSGGTDSLALMILVARWKQVLPTGPKVTVFTVDHGLREEARQETEFVANYARALGFNVRVLRGEINQPESRLQEKARALRYGLMGKAMDEQGLQVLVTAHHLNDQTETILMRLSKGSGISGLGGMAPFSVRDGLVLVRPLLDIPRRALEEFIATTDVIPVEDPSNHNLNFERVRWRKIMPQLHDAGLCAQKTGLAATRLRRADQALNELAERLYADLFVIDPFGCAFFDLEQMLDQPAELGIRLLYRAIDDAGGVHAAPSLSQIEKLYDNLSARMTGAKGTTMGGCGISFHAGLGQIYREAGRMENDPVWVEGGQSTHWDGRFQIMANSDRCAEIRVAPAINIDRKSLETLLPDIPYVPMEAVHAAPLISCGDEILALGEHVLSSDVDVFRTFGPNALM